MTSRGAATLLLGLLALLGASGAAAQPSPSSDPRSRYQRDQRDTDRPRTQQQFDENLRKFEADDLPTRLEGLAGMGQMEKKDGEALPYLLSAANVPASIRAKAIDTRPHAGHRSHHPAGAAPVHARHRRLHRRRILAALGMIGDKRATEPLLDFAGGRANVETRAGAVYAVGEIGDPAAIAAVEQIANGDDESAVRDVAKVAIRRIRARPVPTEGLASLVAARRPPGPDGG
jgi:hypothetical protein